MAFSSFVDIPSSQQQLKFLKQTQQVLQSGSFSSTYKFALLMSLTRLAIEQGNDTGAALHLDYLDIAEKFIDLYWKQTLPFNFKQDENLILLQNNGKQAKVINLIFDAQQKFKTLAETRRDHAYWFNLKKTIAANIKKMPVKYLQNINGQSIEFLYDVAQSQSQSALVLYLK